MATRAIRGATQLDEDTREHMLERVAEMVSDVMESNGLDVDDVIAGLLVQEGFYSNRTDLIRTAIRNQLAIHGDALRHSVARRTLVVGLQDYGRRELEAARDAGERLRIQALGLVRIADDVTPELALEVIESITVLGVLQAAPRLRAGASIP